MKKILIITSEPQNYVPVKLKEAGERLGLEVLIATTECFNVKMADSVVEVKYFDCEKEETIDVTPENFGLVIPRLNDDSLATKAELLRAIESLNIPMLNTANAMINCQEKLQTERELNNAKIKTPSTTSFSNPSSIKEDQFNYPVVLKMNTGSQGIGVMIIDSYRSLKSVAQYLSEISKDFLVQEYLEHEASFRIITLADKVLAANKRTIGKNDFRTNSHQGGKLVKNTEAYEPSEKEIALAMQIAKLLGCGFCAIDYLQVGDDLVILEVNGSPGLEGIQENFPDKNLAHEVMVHCANVIGVDTKVVEPPIATGEEDEEEEVKDEVKPDTEAEEKFLGEKEEIIIKRLNDDQPIPAKVDTGADSCSLHGENIELTDEDTIIKFEYKDVVYRVNVARIVNVVKADLPKVKRGVIKMDVEFHGETYKDVEITIADRGDMKFDFLIGKNLLAMSEMPVKISSPEEE